MANSASSNESNNEMSYGDQTDKEYYTLTEDEQKCVDKLKAEVLEAYCDHALFEHLQSDNILSDQTLTRFCKAKGYHYEESWTLFQRHVAFKQKYGYYDKNINHLEIGSKFINSGIVKFAGLDKNGQIVLAYNVQYFLRPIQEDGTPGKVVEFTEKEMIHAIIYIDKLNNEIQYQINRSLCTFIFDCTNADISHLFQYREFFSFFIHLAQDNFPDTSTKMLVYNAPFGVSALYNFCSIFLSQRTAAKIEFIHSNIKLFEFVNPSELEEKYGGEHTEYPSYCEINLIQEIVYKKQSH